jgi:hypothetical protein
MLSDAAIEATRATRLDDPREKRRRPLQTVGLYPREVRPRELGGGTVGVVASEAARYTQFAIALSALEMPGDSVLRWVISGDRVSGQNELVKNLHGDWLFIMGDDHAFGPGLLRQLLAHDVDVVVPLCLSRRTPFNPYCFQKRDGMVPLDLSACPSKGLVEVEAAGSAGMLIRRHVLEAVGDPWFEYMSEGEDIAFCDKARAAGFKIHVDLGAPLGHIASTILWPSFNGGRWLTGMTVADGFELAVEMQPC